MVRFIIRRLGFVVLTVFLSSVIIFLATQVLPGDMTTMILGRGATEEAKQNLRQELGLDRPAIVRYGSWLGDYVQGDWGNSITTGGEEIRPIIMERLGNSLMLAALAWIMLVPLGIFLGLIAALRRNGWQDQTVSISALALIGLPEFVIGLVLIQIFAIELGWLPSQSSVSPDATFYEALPYLILPAMTVAVTGVAHILRMTRSTTVDVLQSDYVRTAYLKGLPSKKVLFSHVLRNSLAPTVTIIAVGTGWMIGGLIVTESVFGYPGIGRLLLFSIQRRDIQLIQATALLIVIIYCILNLLADIIYAFLNPRIRYS